MARSLSAPWPIGPRTVFFDDVATPPTRTRATKEGRIRRIATGVWTADMVSPVEEIVRANALAIIARRIGAVVLVDRTAAMAGKVDNGVVAVATDERASDLKLPGVTVRVRPMARHKSDIEFQHPGMCLAMPARALVDNLSGPANADRFLTTAELQDWLARKKLDYGDGRFGRLREDAHAVAADFGTDVHDRIEDLFAIAIKRRVHSRPSASLPQSQWPVTCMTISGLCCSPRCVTNSPPCRAGVICHNLKSMVSCHSLRRTSRTTSRGPSSMSTKPDALSN